MTAPTSLRGERGAAEVLGLVLLAPVAIALALLVVFLSRQVDARAQVQSVAESAAQAAALERTASDAARAAQQTVDAALTGSDSCERPMTNVDTSAFRAGGSVTVSVRCRVTPRGLGNVAGSTELGATATAVIDRFRATGDGA